MKKWLGEGQRHGKRISLDFGTSGGPGHKKPAGRFIVIYGAAIQPQIMSAIIPPRYVL